MERMTIQEWREEGIRRFGNNIKNWKFRCPACGHVASVSDFAELGKNFDSAYRECIGRVKGKGSSRLGDNSGCNWTAYGLFGSLGEGIIVVDGREEIEVFPFADNE